MDSVIARLNRVCSEDGDVDNDDTFWDESERERRAKLFEWVVGVGSDPPLC